MRKLWILVILLPLFGQALGQGVDHEFGLPLYWDANTDGVTVSYEAFSSPTSCVDPNPSPANCVAFTKVADVPHAPDSTCSPDCIIWTEPGPVVFGQSTFYRVTACNGSGACTEFSNELELTWIEPLPDVPGQPRTGVTVVVININGNENTVVANFFSGPRVTPHAPN